MTFPIVTGYDECKVTAGTSGKRTMEAPVCGGTFTMLDARSRQVRRFGELSQWSRHLMTSLPTPPMDSQKTNHCRTPFPSPCPLRKTRLVVPVADHEHRLPSDKLTSTSAPCMDTLEDICSLLLLPVHDRSLPLFRVPFHVPLRSTAPSAPLHPPQLPVADRDSSGHSNFPFARPCCCCECLKQMIERSC